VLFGARRRRSERRSSREQMAQQQQRYKVLEKIASGGMAEVFRAESAGLEGFKKTVAIKRVLPHLSQKKQFMGMFLDEARLSAHLSHSNCVQVFDIGVGDNTYFIVMEYVDGSDLKGVIEYRRKTAQPFPIEEACLICVRICEGLTYAHELTDNNGESLHIVHRDMSPPNVLITRFGEVKIVDFGLAKANSQLERSEPGIIKGKFSYLSPEAAQGLPIDARTDVFAVGIILWELLAGRRLFLGDTDLETVRMVQAARVPPIKQFSPKVSAQLEQVIARALAGDPKQRYQTARELGHALNDVLFHIGRSVSSFDIAQLVAPIWRERVERKRREQRDKGSIISSMIDEALFEFTSVQAGDRASSPLHGAQPLSIGSFENHDWGEDLSGMNGGDGAEESGAASFELGNLAALEEDDEPPPPRRQPTPAVPQPAVQLSSNAPSTPLGVNGVDEPAKAGGAKGGLIALLLLLVVAAGMAGAYFGGVLPR
jgi:eukaryotic-like serine/threonine-protein kinase